MRRRRSQGGNALVESSLILLPLLLLVLGTLEISRAMWTYHSLAMAVKSATRLAIVHGARCADASSSCPLTVAQVVSLVQNGAVGLDPASLQITLTTGSTVVACSPSASCSANGTVWPAAPNNIVGLPVSIVAQYSFHSVLPLGLPQGNVNLTAKSTEIIEF